MSSSRAQTLLLERLKLTRSPQPAADKPLFWLGAGCSVHDGVPLNDDLLRAVVPPDPDAWGSLQYQFDQMVEHFGMGSSRATFLRVLDRPIQPDSPYHLLVELLVDGYADTVVTFNIDGLLEQALEAAGLRREHDYLVIRVPEVRPEAVVAQVNATHGPRIRVVKLHGDHTWGFNLMASSEIVQYDERVRGLVGDLSRRTAIVCGYSFFHLNVLEAFSRSGEPLFYVNPAFPGTPFVLSLMAARNAHPLFVDDQAGRFDQLVAHLRKNLPR